MINYTEKIAQKTISFMERDHSYTEEEKVVYQYGMELFLNSFLKMLLYIFIGFIVKKELEVMVTLFVFGIVRKCSGGKHAKSDAGCFLMTGMIVAFAVMSPYIIGINQIEYKVVVLLINMIYLLFAPRDEYYNDTTVYKEKMSAKIQSIIVVNIFLGIGFLAESYWRVILITILVEQGITLLGGKKDE